MMNKGQPPTKPKPTSKIKPVSEEIHNYHSHISSKRSGKSADLLIDDISKGTYCPSTYTSGLKTNHPLFWLQAFETSLNPTRFTSAWFNFSDQSGKVYESQIHLYNTTNQKNFIIHIFLSTGVLLVKGKDHFEWVDLHFHNIKQIYNNLVISHKTTPYPSTFSCATLVSTSSVEYKQPGVSSNSSLCASSESLVTNMLPVTHVINSSDETPSLQYVPDVTHFINSSDETPSLQYVPDINPHTYTEDSISILDSSQLLFSTPSHVSTSSTTTISTSSSILSNTNTSFSTTSCSGISQSRSSIIIKSDLMSSSSNISSAPGVPVIQLVSPSLLSHVPSVLPLITPTISNGTSTEHSPQISSVSKSINVSSAINFPIFNPICTTGLPSPNSVCTKAFSTPSTGVRHSSDHVSSHFDKGKAASKNIAQLSVEDKLNELWLSNRKNWAAIDTMQSGIDNLISQLSGIRSLIDTKFSICQTGISNMQCQIDNKLSAMVDLLNVNLDNKMTALEQKLNKKLDHELSQTKKKIGEFKIKITDQFHTLENNDTCVCSSKVEYLERKMTEILPIVTDFDLGSINAMSDHLVEASTEINVLKNQMAKLSTESNSTKTYTTATQNNKPPGSQSNSKKADKSDNSIIFFMDSNHKILDFKRLWDSSKTRLVKTPTLFEIEKHVNSIINCNTQCVVISCGTNDLDTKDPHQIACEIDCLINDIWKVNSNIQIILSDLLPRATLRIDADVRDVNEIFSNWYRKDRRIFLLRQDKFRRYDGSYLIDEKHLAPEAAPLYAASFRFALKKCLNSSSEDAPSQKPPRSTSVMSDDRHNLYSDAVKDNAWLQSSPLQKEPELCTNLINSIRSFFREHGKF